MEFFMSFRSCRWLKNVSALLQLQLHLDLHGRFGRCFPRRREEPQLELQLLQATSDLLLKEIDT